MPRSAPKNPGPGRPKGSQNKITVDIKQMVINALNKAGGEEYLLQRAQDTPVAFLTLLGKILPTQITGAEGGAIKVDFVTALRTAGREKA